MIDSKIFKLENLEKIQNNLLCLLNESTVFDNPHIAESPRAVGDTVQEVLSERMKKCFPKGLIKDFKGKFSRRAMEDVAFRDTDDNYFVVDIKTHNKNTDFNMPNLTSVKRLAQLYKNDTSYFVILLVEYTSDGEAVIFESVRLIPIEHLKWSCLTIGALGWGQIQIANTKKLQIDREQTRKKWMLKLCDALEDFYTKELSKIEDRIAYFEKVKKIWKQK